eukprot:Polyplicarium_translucidae@DN1597_c0_g1_i1.p1
MLKAGTVFKRVIGFFSRSRSHSSGLERPATRSYFLSTSEAQDGESPASVAATTTNTSAVSRAVSRAGLTARPVAVPTSVTAAVRAAGLEGSPGAVGAASFEAMMRGKLLKGGCAVNVLRAAQRRPQVGDRQPSNYAAVVGKYWDHRSDFASSLGMSSHAQARALGKMMTACIGLGRRWSDHKVAERTQAQDIMNQTIDNLKEGVFKWTRSDTSAGGRLVQLAVQMREAAYDFLAALSKEEAAAEEMKSIVHDDEGEYLRGPEVADMLAAVNLCRDGRGTEMAPKMLNGPAVQFVQRCFAAGLDLKEIANRVIDDCKNNTETAPEFYIGNLIRLTYSLDAARRVPKGTSSDHSTGADFLRLAGEGLQNDGFRYDLKCFEVDTPCTFLRAAVAHYNSALLYLEAVASLWHDGVARTIQKQPFARTTIQGHIFRPAEGMCTHL